MPLRGYAGATFARRNLHNRAHINRNYRRAQRAITVSRIARAVSREDFGLRLQYRPRRRYPYPDFQHSANQRGRGRCFRSLFDKLGPLLRFVSQSPPLDELRV